VRMCAQNLYRRRWWATICDAMSVDKGRIGAAIQREIAPIFFALFMFLFLLDAVHNRLGSSNGKFISLVDTCRSVARYRSDLGEHSPKCLGAWRITLVLISSFLVKFASSTLVSVLLGKVPVVFSGPRHASFFLLGFALIWLSPSDTAYRIMRSSRAVKLLVDMGGGLYKMRKVIFAVESATASGSSFFFALLLAVLSVDGTTLTRRALHFLESLGPHLASQPKRRWCRSFSQILSVSWQAGNRGARQMISSTIFPLSFVTALLWIAASSEWERGITDDSFLGLRAALLALFIWRAGALDELAGIHMESLGMAECTATQPKAGIKAKAS